MTAAEGLYRATAAGAFAVASCLSSCRCKLAVLDLSGCEITDDGAAALAAAIAGSTAAAAVGGVGSVSGSGSASRQARASCSLQQLRLADNQITAAGKPQA